MDRLCRHCGSPATNPKGPPICDGCRGRRHTEAKPRKRKLMACDQCGRRYRTTSGNRLCASCYHQRRKHPCARCGVPVDKRAKVCRQCFGVEHRGPAATTWSGGRTVTVHGYVLVKCPGHPALTGTNAYVREHRLVMEEVLGRYLLPGESVHHVNGVKDDNRPENLELWVRSQPAGQRASDLLEWARGIIATYGPLEAALTRED